jgi:hypothetical protein
VMLHRSSFVIQSNHFMFIIRLRHLFSNVCNLLVVWLVVFHVSQAYNNTDCTFVLNIRSLTHYCGFSILGITEQMRHLQCQSLVADNSGVWRWAYRLVSLLYNGYRVFPGGKAAGAWCWPPTPS